MTAHERGRQRHRRKRRCYAPAIILALVCSCIFAAGFFTGHAAANKTAEPLPIKLVLESAPAPTPEPSAEEEEVALWRDDIVTDGNLLAYDLQMAMQAYCAEYGVPYALALAVADVESRFDPDAASGTNDYGLMQINKVNHGWLMEAGIDPMTPTGNIEAGVLVLSQHLAKYGDPEKALMAYNCGPTGAKRLWDAGTYRTDYSGKVMARFAYWTSILED